MRPKSVHLKAKFLNCRILQIKKGFAQMHPNLSPFLQFGICPLYLTHMCHEVTTFNLVLFFLLKSSQNPSPTTLLQTLLARISNSFYTSLPKSLFSQLHYASSFAITTWSPSTEARTQPLLSQFFIGWQFSWVKTLSCN